MTDKKIEKKSPKSPYFSLPRDIFFAIIFAIQDNRIGTTNVFHAIV